MFVCTYLCMHVVRTLSAVECLDDTMRSTTLQCYLYKGEATGILVIPDRPVRV